ncbi:hypothetical protein [Catellatospora methionotrophica]|uniref:hypothetical protein n=1 Tax=Catellatospora methionotrophica TaxID=121620 RepID=UPI0033F6FF52
MTRPRRAATASAVAAFALVGLVGCGTSSPADRARPARLYPFASAVYYTDAEQRTVDVQLEQATATCMRDRGFSYPPAAAAAGPPSASEPDNPYGLLDLGTARTHGYGIVPAEVQHRRRSPAATPTAPAADPGYELALVGDQQRQTTLDLPDGSQATVASDACVTRARAAVYGRDWDRLYFTVQALSNMVITRTVADPAVATAQTAWSSCLSRAGHRAESPDDLRRAIQVRAQSAADDPAIRAVAKAELAAAEADASCQEQVELGQAIRTAQDRAEQQTLNDQFRRDLEQLRNLKQAALAR